jgi:homocitrate synthase NifV
MGGLIDSTLREGEQMAGVYFPLGLKADILQGLGRVGVDEIELGGGGADLELPDLMVIARSVAPRARLSLWCRCLPQDIDASAALNPDVLSISLPVSDLHIEKRLGRSREWVLDQVGAAVVQARAAGVQNVSIGLEDATRANARFLGAALRLARKAEATRVRIADTVGIATPLVFDTLVRSCKHHSRLEVGVHTHNDFGMATANAIASLQAGADWADVTVLGLGERAGTARLEEVAGFLTLLNGAAYNIAELEPLSALVAQAVGIDVPPHQPIIGRNIFVCETGLHLDGLSKDVRTYEPYAPERVHKQRHALIGKKTGRNAVAAKLREIGVDFPASDLPDLVAALRAQSSMLGRPLTDAEVLTLARNPAGRTARSAG